MAVAMNDTTCSATGTGVSSLSTAANTMAVSGADPALLVFAGVSAGTPPDFSGCTFNTNPTPTTVNLLLNTGAFRTYYRQALYGLEGMSTDTDNITVNFTASADEAYVGACSLTGVDGTTGFGIVADDQLEAADTNTTSLSVTLSTIGSDDMLVDGVHGGYTAAPTYTAGANQTAFNSAAVDAYVSGAMSYQSGSDGGVMSWSWTGNQRVGMIAVRVIAAAGGGGGLGIPIAAYHYNHNVGSKI